VGLLGISHPILIAAAIAGLEALALYVSFAAGQFNASQPGFMAVGAYSAALLTTGTHHSVLIGILLGVAVSLPVAVVLTLATARIRGLYLGMASLAFIFIVQQVIDTVPALKGELGIYGIPVSLALPQCWVILAIAAFLVHRLMSSRLGYEMRILREDALTARAVGISRIRICVITSLIGAVLASLAGSMQALTSNAISPDNYGFSLVIVILSFVVVGGSQRYWGPILGAIVLTVLPQFIQDFGLYESIISGVIILIVIIMFPDGLAGVILLGWDWVSGYFPRRRRVPPGPAADAKLPEQTEVAGPVCEVVGVKKHFGGVLAVNNANLNLQRGRVHGLIGPNGAGKSTLVDLISGEQQSDSGIIRLEGRDITRLSAHARARLGVSRTFQHTKLTQSLTALEIVYSGCLVNDRTSILGHIIGLPAARRAHRQARSRADMILNMVGLATIASEYVRKVDWEKQRTLEIARSLALRPRVLLLDEPAAGMHAESLGSLTALIRAIAEAGVAVVLIEHNVGFILATAEVLYAMDAGSIIAYGEPESVMRQPAVSESYLGVQPA
jgi:branched-chain amino acid transport system permease protein